jgi:Flp pilus assembly protein TadB
MTVVVLLAVATGIGLVGVAYGLRAPAPTLAAALDAWQQADRVSLEAPPAGAADRLGRAVVAAWVRHRPTEGPGLRRLRSALAVTDGTLDRLVGRMVVGAAAGLLGPPTVWLVLGAVGVAVPVPVVVLAVALLPAAALALPVVELRRAAAERRRQVRAVVASFVDLVIMGLAGGVGVDGAVLAAAQASPAWGARRMTSALLAARERGAPPWTALERLGADLGVQELVELAAVVQLAGTEGSRIRQALESRSAALRRHAQAEAESAANAMTERLFAPGALLLVGFLIFIGYPALQRILGGFA